MFTVDVNDYTALLQMVILMENRREGGPRLQHSKAVLMKDMW